MSLKIVIFFAAAFFILAGVFVGNKISVFDAGPKESDGVILDLSNKKLNFLSAEIGEMENIEELYLGDNNLTGALPAEIRKMQKLRILDASNNKLTGIPAEIGQLKYLEELDLSFNNIDTMPNEIENIKNNLRLLDLTGNSYKNEQIDNIRAKLPYTEVRF